MNVTENYPKYALSGRMEIHPYILRDIGPLGPLTMCDPWMTFLYKNLTFNKPSLIDLRVVNESCSNFVNTPVPLSIQLCLSLIHI